MQTTPVKRAIAAAAGALIVASTFAALPASAADNSSTTTSSTTAKKTPAQRLSDFLAPLVTNGTITQAQADAIVAAKTAEAAARQAKQTEFRTKAEPIIAAAYGLTVEKYREALSLRTLPKLTAEQRTALKTQLDALAKSLGLTEAPRFGKGSGKERGKGKRH